MLEYLLLGGGFAFAAAVQPGPLQAFLFCKVVEQGWRRTLPAALAPLLSDGPIALVVLLVLTRFPDTIRSVLQVAGGLVLLYLARGAYVQWRRGPAPGVGQTGSAPRTFFQAAAVNVLNPNPYLGWGLVLGPAAVQAWHGDPRHAVALIVAFYATMIATLVLLIVGFGATRLLGSRGRRALVVVSAAMLAALGVYQLGAGLLSAGTHLSGSR